jgi:hypothetical protein
MELAPLLHLRQLNTRQQDHLHLSFLLELQAFLPLLLQVAVGVEQELAGVVVVVAHCHIPTEYLLHQGNP